MELIQLGWNAVMQEKFAEFEDQGFIIGRVATEHSQIYRVYTEQRELLAELSGKMRFNASERADLPAVGDWVAIKEHGDKALIHAILPRKSKFSRKVAGTVIEEQIVAANVDYVFIVISLNNDFNLRRMQRYLLLAGESGVTPVIVLSKADLCNNAADRTAEVRTIAVGAPIHVISSISNEGLEELAPYLKQGMTVAVLGSSGVGKSTLINCLMGKAVQKVNEIRQGDDRGKHTTTHRELLVLPNGGLLIDTPGMRELQLWGTEEGLSAAFKDIELVAAQCFYNDCKHIKEPGCAVKAAMYNGTLDSDRIQDYKSMGNELAHLSLKAQKTVKIIETEKGKKGLRRAIDKAKGKSGAKFRKNLTKKR